MLGKTNQLAVDWCGAVGVNKHRCVPQLEEVTVTHGMSMQETCPVHVIGPVLDSVAHGSKLFGGATAANALCTLRFILGQMITEHMTCDVATRRIWWSQVMEFDAGGSIVR